MDLLNGALDVSPFTFLGSFEDEKGPFFDADFAIVERNSFGRPVQRVSPMTREQEILRPIAYLRHYRVPLVLSLRLCPQRKEYRNHYHVRSLKIIAHAGAFLPKQLEQRWVQSS